MEKSVFIKGYHAKIEFQKKTQRKTKKQWNMSADNLFEHDMFISQNLSGFWALLVEGIECRIYG